MQRVKSLLAAAGALAIITAGTTTAFASTQPANHPYKVVTLHRANHVATGKPSGVIPPVGTKVRAPKTIAACTDFPQPICPMAYHGGSVQHSPKVYLLLWGPAWSSDPAQEATAQKLKAMYSGLGTHSDRWSRVTSPYRDTTGRPQFTGSVFAGTYQDTTVPPKGVTDNALAAEADAFASVQGLTGNINADVVVATQSGTCPSGFYAPSCSGGNGNYCAWHSYSSVPFTNLPYVLDSGKGCGENFINPGTGGLFDGLTIVAGHEYAETITDPDPTTGWWDSADFYGGEIGDKCAWAGENWGGSDPDGNITLSTGTFAMQSLWSNAHLACIMHPYPVA